LVSFEGNFLDKPIYELIGMLLQEVKFKSAKRSVAFFHALYTYKDKKFLTKFESPTITGSLCCWYYIFLNNTKNKPYRFDNFMRGFET
jgi:hypothetical protein